MSKTCFCSYPNWVQLKRLVIDATLRAAAPYQKLQREKDTQKIKRVEKSDMRAKRMALKAAALVGDGTTTVVLFAGEFLKEAKPFIEDGVHSQSLIRSFRATSNLAISKIKELAVSIEGKSMEEKKSLLAKCVATTLSSK
ncbi:hypothetical protein IFM89_016080, partial [Coptis chinensis]